MCFISRLIPYKRIAEKDIFVQKLLTYPHMYSPFFFEEWIPNQLKTAKIGEITQSTLGEYCINEGIHSAKSILRINIRTYISGRTTLNPTVDCKVYEAFIPKGSEYYVNDEGEYVSNQLIIL